MPLLAAFFFLWVFALSQISPGVAKAPKELDLSCPNCNIIFLNLDLLRADFVGLRGLRPSITPNLDRFFSDGIRFTDVTSVSGATAISNTATLTSKNGHFTYTLLKNTFVDRPPQMPPKYLTFYSRTPTIAEVLHAEGYETVNVNHGWYAGKQMLLNRGFDKYWGTGEADSVSYEPAAAIEKTAEFIRNYANSNKKFFLLMRSEDLRGFPYRYPRLRPRLIDPRVRYVEVDPKFVEVRYQIGKDGFIKEGYSSFDSASWMSDLQLEEYSSLSKRLYSQQLSFVDERLAAIFLSLRDGDLLETTIVVLYSNHGDGLYDNKVPNHGVSYQSCVSVPILIKHPKIKAPLVVQTSVSLIDLVPTIYSFISIKAPTNIDGVSLEPVIYGKRGDRKFLFGVDRQSQFVRMGFHKLIVWADQTRELYNLNDDPAEQRNIAPTNPDLVAGLYGVLLEHGLKEMTKALSSLQAYRSSGKFKE